MKKKYEEIKKVGIIEAAKRNIIKNIKITVSGGKDSIATLVWAKESLSKYCNIKGIFVKTKLEFKNIDKYLKYISEKLNIPIEIRNHSKKEDINIRNKMNEMAKIIGVPFKIRYCEGTYKVPLYKIEGDEIYDITLLGNRWGESSKRADTSYLYYEKKQIFYNPIQHWTSIDVYNYLKENEIPLFFSYKNLRRLSCSLCPLVFLRSKISTDIIFSKQNKKYVNFDFFYNWFDNILNVDMTKFGKVLRDRHERFKKNYEITKIIDEAQYNLYDRNIPVFEYFY